MLNVFYFGSKLGLLKFWVELSWINWLGDIFFCCEGSVLIFCLKSINEDRNFDYFCILIKRMRWFVILCKVSVVKWDIYVYIERFFNLLRVKFFVINNSWEF